MTFLGFANPLGLLGLLSLPVIVALHLLRQRRQQYVVSSLRLWSFLEMEVRGSRLRRIPLTWVLLLQLLVATLLSLAWAQPEIELATIVPGGRHQVILLDVSASMGAQDVRPSRFTQARLQAITLLGNLGPRDTATVVTFGATPAWIGDTREIGLQSLVDRLSTLEPGELGSGALEEALALGQAALRPEIPAEFHILTDGALPQPNLEAVGGPVHWRLYGRSDSNQAILHLAAEAVSESQFQIFARAANFGDVPARRIITLLLDGQPVDSTSLYLEPDALVSHVWTVNGRPDVVTVELAGGDRLPADDTASIGLRRSRQLRVGLVAGDPEPLRRAIAAVPGVDLTVMAPDEYLQGMAFDAVFFREALPRVWPGGVVVLVDPPANNGLAPVEGLVEIGTDPVSGTDPMLTNVNFGGVRWGHAWAVQQLPEGFAPLLRTAEIPLLARGERGDTQVYLFLLDLRSGNLTRHPAFPILVANIVQTAGGVSLPAQLTAGQGLPLPDAELYPGLRLHLPGGEIIVFEGRRPAVWPDTREPGVYGLELTDWHGDRETAAVGVNGGDLAESAIGPHGWAPEEGATVTVEGETAERRIALLPWLLGTALLLLLVEAYLAWR